MYRLHCSKCERIIEPHENFFKLTYIEFGVGNYAAAPRNCEVCAACFTDFRRSVEWEIGRCEDTNCTGIKPPVVGTISTIGE
jgi:hypothetical protein